MTEELKEQIHERVYNIKVPTLGFSRRDLFNIAMEYAEPREKRIAELEKNAKNAWDENVRLVVNLRNEIESLKKENAELKEQCSILADCNTCTSACKTENIEMKNNLIKAKEIIREFMKYEINEYDGSLEIHFEELKKQAEQFISEVEK